MFHPHGHNYHDSHGICDMFITFIIVILFINSTLRNNNDTLNAVVALSNAVFKGVYLLIKLVMEICKVCKVKFLSFLPFQKKYLVESYINQLHSAGLDI